MFPFCSVLKPFSSTNNHNLHTAEEKHINTESQKHLYKIANFMIL